MHPNSSFEASEKKINWTSEESLKNQDPTIEEYEASDIFGRRSEAKKANLEIADTIRKQLDNYLLLLFRKEIDQLKEDQNTKSESAPDLAHLRRTEYFYPKKDWPLIHEALNHLSEVLEKLANNHQISFLPDNHLKHIIGNSPQGMLYLAEKRAKKIIKEGVDLSQKDADPIIRLKEGKEAIDALLYYLDYIENNPEALKKELTAKNGWLENFKSYYINDKSEPIDDLDSIPSELRTRHINFFARLMRWESNLDHLRGLDNISDPITSENFDEEFSKLVGNKYLNKEKIRIDILEKDSLKQAA